MIIYLYIIYFHLNNDKFVKLIFLAFFKDLARFDLQPTLIGRMLALIEVGQISLAHFDLWPE